MCQFCIAAKVCADPHEVVIATPADAFPLTALTIPDDDSTREVIAVDGIALDRLDAPGDEDWFRLDLVQGQTVQIDLQGTGSSPLSDPFLRLFDANSELVAFNDDGGAGLNSSLIFTAPAAGTYYIEVDSYAGRGAGDYRLSVVNAQPPKLIDAVQGDTRLDTDDPVLVYFAEAGDTYNDRGTTYTASGVNAYEQAQLWSIFEGVEAFLDIDFQITTNRAAADLEWATDTLSPSLLGFFYFPDIAGEGGFGVLNNASTRWDSAAGGSMDTGGFMYGVALHELGHGLGLGHPHDTGNGTQTLQGVGFSGNLGQYDLNQTVFTAMSYNDGWQTHPDGHPGTDDYGYNRSFGAIDIAALQDMYGANRTYRAGDDVYALDGVNLSGTGFTALWDTGGEDEIRYQGFRDANIDLRAATLAYEEGGGGFVSHVSGIHGGFTIAKGVLIENATGGSGDDLLTGNDVANRLSGGAGHDTLDGGAGDDLLLGGDGHDLLRGGAGVDTASYADATVRINADLAGMTALKGLAEGDSYSGIENLTGGRGNDMLRGDGGENLIAGGDGSDRLYGRAGADTLLGEAGVDRLYGNGGADTLIGGDGNDRFIFFTLEESRSGHNKRDIIVDYTAGDVIELNRLDADESRFGNQGFDFIGGEQFSETAGELRFYRNVTRDSVIVEADTDGDAIADLQLELAGLSAIDKSAFLL
ncbi:MAG: M10 family metallopeptidase C-terminal domain-containing protein [Pseudomonadota bacterium]